MCAAVANMGERVVFVEHERQEVPNRPENNRATAAGCWRATGKDREVHTANGAALLIGMKNTLIFYKGRAHRGHKTKWVRHEYCLAGHFSYPCTCKVNYITPR